MARYTMLLLSCAHCFNRGSYTDLAAIVSTDEWVSQEIPLGIGVYQGDPMSVVIFLTFMATLSDKLKTRQELRVRLVKSESLVNHPLYADDTCIISSSPSGCQHLLDMVLR